MIFSYYYQFRGLRKRQKAAQSVSRNYKTKYITTYKELCKTKYTLKRKFNSLDINNSYTYIFSIYSDGS